MQRYFSAFNVTGQLLNLTVLGTNTYALCNCLMCELVVWEGNWFYRTKNDLHEEEKCSTVCASVSWHSRIRRVIIMQCSVNYVLSLTLSISPPLQGSQLLHPRMISPIHMPLLSTVSVSFSSQHQPQSCTVRGVQAFVTTCKFEESGCMQGRSNSRIEADRQHIVWVAPTD